MPNSLQFGQSLYANGLISELLKQVLLKFTVNTFIMCFGTQEHCSVKVVVVVELGPGTLQINYATCIQSSMHPWPISVSTHSHTHTHSHAIVMAAPCDWMWPALRVNLSLTLVGYEGQRGLAVTRRYRKEPLCSCPPLVPHGTPLFWGLSGPNTGAHCSGRDVEQWPFTETSRVEPEPSGHNLGQMWLFGACHLMPSWSIQTFGCSYTPDWMFSCCFSLKQWGHLS